MTDITRSGSRVYSPADRAHVIAVFNRLVRTGGTPIPVDALAATTGRPGRTVRQIMVDADGVEFLLKGGDKGYDVAKTYEEAKPYIARLKSQATTMLERVHRVEAYARRMTEPNPTQPTLFCQHCSKE